MKAMMFDKNAILILLCLTSAIQSGMFFQQCKLNKSVNGPGWWALWNIFIFCGSACALAEMNPSLQKMGILLESPLLLAGFLSLYIGLIRFYSNEISFKFILPLYISYLLGHFFFGLSPENNLIRILLFDLCAAVLSFQSLIYIIRQMNRKGNFEGKSNIIYLSFDIILFCTCFLLLFVGIPQGPIGITGSVLLLQAVGTLLINLLLTFSLINMTTQKMHTGISEIINHFEQIFNTTPDAVAISRLSDGLYVNCNPSFYRISGYSQGEVIGKTSLELNIWENHEDRLALAKTIKETGVHEGFETTFIRKDGTIINGFLSAKIIYLRGEPHLLTITRDITSRKSAEKALRENKEQLQLIINSALEAIVVLVNQRFVYFNKKMVEFSGYSDAELVNKDILDLVHPEDAPTLLENYKLRLSGGIAPERYAVRLVQKEGGIRWLELGGVKIEWQGNPATITFITDITEKKLAELEIIAGRDKLEKLNSEKDKFFSIIAHDLRSPFAGLLGLTEMIADGAEEFTLQELKNMGGQLHQTANKLYKLLKNLLEWSQMQRGMLEYQPQWLNLNQTIDESMETLQKRSEQKAIQIVSSIDKQIQVYADKNMLNSILLNLLSNAIKFTRRNGNILITGEKKSNRFVEIAVHDSGIGISKEDIDKLFRLDSKVRSQGTEGELSTGLGLLLCKEFVERHGGRIWVDSEIEKGSTFHFTLPVSD